MTVIVTAAIIATVVFVVLQIAAVPRGLWTRATLFAFLLALAAGLLSHLT